MRSRMSRGAFSGERLSALAAAPRSITVESSSTAPTKTRPSASNVPSLNGFRSEPAANAAAAWPRGRKEESSGRTEVSFAHADDDLAHVVAFLHEIECGGRLIEFEHAID